MKKYKRPYVGIKFRNTEGLRPIYETFRAAEKPTEASHGELYGAVIGPFRTMRGAHFMRDFGHLNPHCQTVAEAERLAKRYQDAGVDPLVSHLPCT